MKFFCIFIVLMLPLAASAAPLTFTDMKGDAHTLAQFEGFRLVLLWRADCAPCREEVKALPELARNHPHQTFLLISLQKGTLRPLKNIPENLHLLIANATSAAVFEALGDTKHALPYSAGLHADGSVCKQHYGLLGSERIEQWADQCD